MEYVKEGPCEAKYKVDQEDSRYMIVRIRVNENVQDRKVFYIASAPPEFRASYSGSGLPYANPSQAFDNTENQGTITLDHMGKSEIRISYPNAYYAGLGTDYIPPTVYLNYNNGFSDKVVSIKLSDGIPYRMLTYPIRGTVPRKDVMFYNGMWELPVRTQEQVLRDSAYPPLNKMHANFWGLKPPV
jgi:hypothetical protein